MPCYSQSCPCLLGKLFALETNLWNDQVGATSCGPKVRHVLLLSVKLQVLSEGHAFPLHFDNWHWRYGVIKHLHNALEAGLVLYICTVQPTKSSNAFTETNLWAAQRGFTRWHRALGKILSFWLALWCMVHQGCIGSHLAGPDLTGGKSFQSHDLGFSIEQREACFVTDWNIPMMNLLIFKYKQFQRFELES